MDRSIGSVVQKEHRSRSRAIAAAVVVAAVSVMSRSAAAEDTAPPAVTLEQVRNGTGGSPIDPGAWVTGNAGPSNSHYVEGYSIPYRGVMTDMPTDGTIVELDLGYDIKHSDAHAIDYLTFFDRLEPHNVIYGHSGEVIDPRIGISAVSASPLLGDDTTPIPAPSSAGSPVTGMPTSSFNALPAGERVMTLYNGTFVNCPGFGSPVVYLSEGDLTASQSETQIRVCFTLSNATAVLSWGGHIGLGTEWAPQSSAGGISGSPYHMRLLDWNLNNLGNQDRSLSADAINPCDFVTCDDGNPCTDDICDAGTGDCSFVPNDANACDDGLFCNGTESCVSGTCQSSGNPCDDGVACTIDSCDEDTDTCTNTPDDSVCANGLFCDGVETCDPVNGCQAGTPVDCDDGVSCTVDSCDEANDTCVNTPDDGQCDNGLFCDGTEVCDPVNGCEAGTPVDCDDGVVCTVDSCDETNDTCVNSPDDSQCDNGLFCDGVETCDPLNGCQAGTPVDCDDGVSCTVDSCDEANDTCVNSPVDSACDDGAFCNGVETCDPLNDCQAGTPVDCDDGVACTVDSCDEINDTCANSPDDAACDDGAFCNGVETCDPINGCEAGTPVDCDDGVGCTQDVCDETNDTCVNNPNDSACDDGQFCNGDEFCDPSLDCQAGTPVDCDDGIACTVDSCDEANDQCVHSPDDTQCDDGNPCTDDACVPGSGCEFTPDDSNSCSDGLFCNGLETCVGGTCQPGSDPCNDGVACTIDVCDEDTDSCTNTADDSFCNDGLFCNGEEFCDPSLDCQAGTPVDCSHLDNQCNVGVCDDTLDQCVQQAANEGFACDDGLFCTINDQCVSGTCVGDPRSCDDAVACTVDSCDEANDTCVNDPDDSVCDNGLFCDGEEFCDPVNGCQPGAGDPCDPQGLKCDEDLDTCVECLNDGQCDDGQFCNGQEFCDGVGVCQPGTPVTCDDGVTCTTDACDESLDQCVFTPVDSVCDNGLFCDGAEFCDPTLDCQPGTPVNCDDGVSCTVDTCDESLDQCVSTPDDGFCDNGLFCDGVETCDPQFDCQAGMPVDCSHLNNQCNVGVCDENQDSCVREPANENQPCDDGLFCTVGEVCVSGACNNGDPRDCGDGIDCTTDSCDETNDQCVHNPNNGLCDDSNPCTDDTCDPQSGCVFTPDDTNSCSDGKFCNGEEACVSGSCEPGADPCDDGVDCTTDLCNEQTDSCTNNPDDSVCSDGQFCNGAEVCDPVNGCQAGNPPDCDDGVACTIDTCDETTDDCVNTPDDSLCPNDDSFCNGDEVCDAVNGCVSTGNPCGGGTPLCCEASETCAAECCEAADCADGNRCTTESCSTGVCVNTPVVCADDGAFCNGAEACNPATGQCESDGDPCAGTSSPFCCEQRGVCTADAGECSAIPTTSEWGMVVLTLLLLVGARLYFRPREDTAGTIT